jgi:hypothetical protein
MTQVNDVFTAAVIDAEYHQINAVSALAVVDAAHCKVDAVSAYLVIDWEELVENPTLSGGMIDMAGGMVG